MKNKKPMFLKLKCNYLSNPLAVQSGEIIFSFCKNGYIFDTYTLAMSSSEENLEKGIYDIYEGAHTGVKVCLRLEGRAGARVYWHIITENAVSETAYFEWAEDLSKAKWLTAERETKKILLFKKDFSVKEGLCSARLHICGLGFYDCKLNSATVDNSFFKPDFSDYIKRTDAALMEKMHEEYYAYYNSYDVTSFLQSGNNCLTAEVAPGYFNNTDMSFISYWHFGQHRLKFMLVLDYADDKEYIVSDEDCLCAVTNSDSTLYAGDRLDFSEKEYAFTPVRILEDKIDLIPALSQGDKVGEVFYPKLVKESGNKKIYDFGQNHTGGLSCVLNGEKGTEVVVRYAEVMGEDGELNFKTASFDGESPQSSRYILSGEEDTVRPKFSWYCYRYIEVDSDKPICVKDLRSLFIHADIKRNGDFYCSEKIFNDLYEKYLYTQLCNMHAGIPMDCPHREKKPYTGDGHLTTRAVSYNFDAKNFYIKWLKDIIHAQEIDGYIPHTAPRMGCGGGFYWGFAIIEIPKTLYQITGDKSYIEKSYSAVEKWVEFFNTRHNGDYLPKNNGREWCLSDWLSPEEVSIDTRYFNAVTFYLSVKALNEFHEILHGTHLDWATELAKKVRAAINNVYFDKEKLCYSKGIQGETVFALWAGIPEKEDVSALQAALRKYYTDVTNGHFDTGIILTPILLEYLTDNGMEDLALTMMTKTDYPSFAYLLDGETTISEHWSKKWISYKFSEDSDNVVEGGGDLSHCHPMFGSVVSWLFERVAGLDIRHACNKEITISPKFIAQIRTARANKKLDEGEVAVDYNAEKDFVLHAKIPEGIVGKIRIDNLHGDFEVAHGENIKSVHAQENLHIDIPCGEWTLRQK